MNASARSNTLRLTRVNSPQVSDCDLCDRHTGIFWFIERLTAFWA